MSAELIKKAVTLADGWTYEADPENGDYFYIQVTLDSGNAYNILGCSISDPFQPSLDALAAQLVRQVDALDNKGVEAWPGYTAVVEMLGDLPAIGYAESSDRTVNTIKAIVDSGVLG